MRTVHLVGLLSSVLVMAGRASQPPYQDEPLLYEKFPDKFVWAVATSAYQIEGAWDVDGKGASIWDTFTHEPAWTDAGWSVVDNATGDVAVDSYHRWRDDIDALKKIGVTHYRFSVAWTRILPKGVGDVSQAGVMYYRNLIDGLLQAKIEPMVTLYHWDLPQALEDRGGWLSDESSDWFEEYARATFRALGKNVKMWITVNEPYVTCIDGYGYGTVAPGQQGIGEKPYVCAHNIIKAHAKAYRVYQNEFAKTQKGVVGISLSTDSIFPLTASTENENAAERELQFYFGWFAHPIFKNGDYPSVMIERVKAKSQAQGMTRSRLPKFTDEEKAMIFRSADFLGVNHYTSRIIGNKVNPPKDVSVVADRDTVASVDDTWPTSGSSWLRPVPKGIRRLLNWIRKEYGSVPIYVTENGFSDRAGNLDDMGRIYYLKHYINQVLKAIRIDDVDVRGYTVWTLMDNFEWAKGYTEKFGLFAVDRADPSMKRVMKSSAAYYAMLIRDNGFVRSSCPYYDIMAGTSAGAGAGPSSSGALSTSLLLAIFNGIFFVIAGVRLL